MFKDQINVISNEREDGVKAEDGVRTEDGEVTGNVHHRYFGTEYKNLFVNIFQYGLTDGDLHLTNFDNWHLALTNTVNTYLEENIYVNDRLFNFEISIKKLANVDDKVNVIIDCYKRKTEAKYGNREIIVTVSC